MKRPLTVTLTALILSALIPSISLAGVWPQQSDNSLRWARAHVERDIDMLQRDNRDYDGHRVKAIEAFQDSRNQITVALTYDKYHDYNTAMAPMPSLEANNYNRSDANLAYVRQDIDNVIDVLQRDNTDYGGHRVDAIGRLQQGREQIEEALESDRGH